MTTHTAWIKVNGRNPSPPPRPNIPVYVVACAFADPIVEVMAWTGKGWSTHEPWTHASKDGDDIFYWTPKRSDEIPELPHSDGRRMWAEGE